MKSPYVSDLEPNQQVTATFLVQFKDVRQKKSGESFLNLILADRTGEVEAKMWDNVDKIVDTFDKDDFVRVKGVPQIFQNRLQFTVHSLARAAANELDLADFLPASKRDPEEMFRELTAIISGIENPHLRAMLEAVFANEQTARLFKRAPAAKAIHHAWLGGLIEHVLQLCALCRAVAPRYPGVDIDLMLTGAILHDIGKIEELTYERSFGYSDTGQLLGHIHIGLGMAWRAMESVPDFPPRLRVLVEHLILSHHGELEYGSPKTPMFAEAMLLHHLDNLDAKMETVRGAIERDRVPGQNFTPYIQSLERPLLRKERFLNPPPDHPKPGSPAPRPDDGQPPRNGARATSNSTMADRLKQALGG